MYFQSAKVRKLILMMYRPYASSIFLLSKPRIIINSYPKSGTHLLTSMLKYVPSVMHSGIHMDPWDFHIKNGVRDKVEEFCLDKKVFEKTIKKVRYGQIATGHFPWDNKFHSFIENESNKFIFMIRDPRDILVSQMKYITGLRRHYLHDLFIGMKNDDERMLAIINGVERDGVNLVEPLHVKLKERISWYDCKSVLSVRFEDIIGKRGGGVDDLQYETIKKITDHINRPLSDIEVIRVAEQLAESKSFTLRKGVIGDWKNHLNDEHKNLLYSSTSKYLIKFGYVVE